MAHGPRYALLLLLTACWAALPRTSVALAPRRLRLSLGGGDASPLVVTWATDGGVLPAAVCLEWESARPADGGKLDQPSLRRGAEPQRRCASDASASFYDPGVNATTQVIHSMELRAMDLAPGRPFRYRVAVVDTSVVWSPWQAAHMPGSPTEEVGVGCGWDRSQGELARPSAPNLPCAHPLPGKVQATTSLQPAPHSPCIVNADPPPGAGRHGAV